MSTPEMTPEEEFVRCFVTFMMSKEPGVWERSDSSLAETVIKNKKHKRLRLMVDFDYDDTDGPSLNFHKRMLSILENHYL